MAMRKSPRQALAPADWSWAAYRAIGRGGVGSVGVEPIAVELGATKGSFYWHFKNREALLEAALDEWEARLTDAVIADLERVPEPGERLKKLVGAAFDLAAPDAAAEVALLAEPEQPAVRRRVRRVTQRRLDYMAAQLERLGWPADQSRERAILLYYLYVGSLQTRHVLPRQADETGRRQQVEVVFEGLLAPASSAGDATRARGSATP
jgi:AcrR family transcriptional regulator